jgi:hypothetical protein
MIKSGFRAKEVQPKTFRVTYIPA